VVKSVPVNEVLSCIAEKTRRWEEEEEEYNLRGTSLLIPMSSTHQIESTVIPIVISKATTPTEVPQELERHPDGRMDEWREHAQGLGLKVHGGKPI
jgi:hypothetical protein